MNNHLNLNVLQDYVDMFGGQFELKVQWHKGELSIEQDQKGAGGLIRFTQMPLTSNTEKELKEAVLQYMPGIHKILVNNTLEVTQKVTEPNKIGMNNKFGQAMDFEITLFSNRPAVVKPFTYFGIQHLEHDHTYMRALFTTNPYFAVVFNGIRIVPYERDIEELGEKVIQAVKAFAKKKMKSATAEESELQFKVEKAFEITFYLGKENVTEDIQRLLHKKKENQTTLDEFGFIAYITYYKLFNGELNQRVPLNQL